MVYKDTCYGNNEKEPLFQIEVPRRVPPANISARSGKSNSKKKKSHEVDQELLVSTTQAAVVVRSTTQR